ncbi:MAG: 4-phosphoerythronate dehydrogenase [Pseudohongiellaceae bacterium]
MKIVADENIANLEEVFQGPWQILTRPGREISPQDVQDAEILLVRSVTKVDAKLLSGSSVRFVGTATSGTDHIDRAYLQEQNIDFYAAAGANANAVVEYVFCALAQLQVQYDFNWPQARVGIIGAGHIGGRLATILKGLGMDYVIHDPFLDHHSEHADKLVPLADVLDADVITLHVPLTVNSPYPTQHLLDTALLRNLPGNKVLINTSRGAVIDSAALLARLQVRQDLLTVIDAWENEPDIDLELLNAAALTTPHIAGYSTDAKRNASELLRAHCSLLPPWQGGSGADPSAETINIPFYIETESILNHCLLAAYSIFEDHLRMQHLLLSQQPGADFDCLRREYRQRLEFSHFRVTCADPLSPWIRHHLKVLGFLVDQEASDR